MTQSIEHNESISEDKTLLMQLPRLLEIINIDANAKIEYDGCGSHSFSIYWTEEVESLPTLDDWSVK